MTVIFNQQTDVTSPFNEQMFIEGLKSQLSSDIFKHLINKEVSHLKITVTIEIPEEGE